jgi:cation diffusion facilitator CzcD-associated flavoprotein CzcO
LRTFIEENASNIAHGRGLAQIRAGCEAGLQQVRDPGLRAKLTPTYEPGCKRLVMSGTFFDAIQKPAVKLVTDGIACVEPQGVRTNDGTLHEIDILILATGFKADWYLRPTQVTGLNGTTLDSLWENGPLNYKSVGLPDMPNLFFINGPYSPGGSASVVDVIEAHVGYIRQLIGHVVRHRVALTPKRDVAEELLQEIRARGRNTVWATGGCKSWYLDKDGVPLYNPLSIKQLREQLAVPQWEHFNRVPLKT